MTPSWPRSPPTSPGGGPARRRPPPAARGEAFGVTAGPDSAGRARGGHRLLGRLRGTEPHGAQRGDGDLGRGRLPVPLLVDRVDGAQVAHAGTRVPLGVR